MIGGNVQQPGEQIAPKRAAVGSTTQRIGDILVDFCVITRQPVHLCSRGRERFIEFAETQLIEKGAVAKRTESPRLDTGQQHCGYEFDFR